MGNTMKFIIYAAVATCFVFAVEGAPGRGSIYHKEPTPGDRKISLYTGGAAGPESPDPVPVSLLNRIQADRQRRLQGEFDSPSEQQLLIEHFAEDEAVYSSRCMCTCACGDDEYQ